MSMNTQNWISLLLQVLPVVIKMIWGKKATKLDFLNVVNNQVIPRARARRRA